MKRIYLILSLLGLAGTASVWTLRKNYTRSFDRDVIRLLSQAKPDNREFTYDQLTGLPDPVQRYFRHVLPEDYLPIRSVRLKHDGFFKTGVDKDWVPIAGEQYFAVNPPGFIWQGTTRLFTARDQYVTNQGQLVVHLFSLIKVVDEHGPTVDQGELLRWLGESVWFPTNLLPSERLQWDAIDDRRAKLSFTHNRLTINYMVYFNKTDEIVRLETHRYMTPERLEPWVGQLSDYRRINGVLIPTRIQATWELPDGNHTYADFYVKEIAYNVPEN